MKKLQETGIDLDEENFDFDELGNPHSEGMTGSADNSSEGGIESEESLIDPNALNDETITQDQINEFKMLGIYKPPGVSWERWQRIQDIRPEHEHMIHLAAS